MSAENAREIVANAVHSSEITDDIFEVLPLRERSGAKRKRDKLYWNETRRGQERAIKKKELVKVKTKSGRIFVAEIEKEDSDTIKFSVNNSIVSYRRDDIESIVRQGKVIKKSEEEKIRMVEEAERIVKSATKFYEIDRETIAALDTAEKQADALLKRFNLKMSKRLKNIEELEELGKVVVELKSGRSLIGMIEKETPDSIVLKFEHGNVVLRRDRIQNIKPYKE